MFRPRPYQLETIDAIENSMRAGRKSVLTELPTGAGKTIVMAESVRRWKEQWPETRVLILAHAQELVAQNAAKLRVHWDRPDQIGVFCASLNRKQADRPITYASVQSVVRNLHAFDGFDVIMIDECHHIPVREQGAYNKVIDHFRGLRPHAVLVGLTATPYRLDGGLIYGPPTAKVKPLFDRVEHRVAAKTLIDQNYLCRPISRVGVKTLDTSGLRKRGREFRSEDVDALVNQRQVIADAVAELVEIFEGDGRQRWLVFCASICHAKSVREEMVRCGVPTGIVHSMMNQDDRRKNLRDFESGKLTALCNVNVLSEGYDCPRIDAIAMLRPTLSPGLYYQQVGRGFRTHEEKDNVLILDFVGNVMEHGPIDLIIPPGRPVGEEPGEAPTKTCPDCMAVIHAAQIECPECGHVFDFEESAPHDDTPVDAPILSDEASMYVDWHPVTDVSYAIHTKPGKPDSLKITYHSGLRRFSEWICPNHGGYPADRADAWRAQAVRPGFDEIFGARVGGNGRAWNLSAAILLAGNGGFRQPTDILVDESTKYASVKNVRYARGDLEAAV